MNKYKMLFALSVTILSGCSTPTNRFFAASMSENMARTALERNHQPVAPVEIVYYSRANGKLYSTLQHIDGVHLHPVDRNSIIYGDPGFRLWIQCSERRDCNSDAFENCKYTGSSPNIYDVKQAQLFYESLKKRGFPVVLVTFSPSGGNNTTEVEYFAECDKIEADFKAYHSTIPAHHQDPQ